MFDLEPDMTSTAVHTLVSSGYDHDEDLLDFRIECPLVNGACPDDGDEGPCDMEETIDDLFVIDVGSPFAEPGSHPFRVQYTRDPFGEHDAHVIHTDQNATEKKA